MQEMQLAENEIRVEGVARPCAHINDIQTLVHQVSHRNKLMQDEFRSRWRI